MLLIVLPSSQDIVFIGNAFKLDPKNSWYQIFLIVCSGFILLFYLSITHIVFILNVFYYLAIAGIYFALKFSILGVQKLIVSLRDPKKPRKLRSNLSRRRY
ncbi:MAG: hypothetical protein ACFFG0_32110, partial [Candidatus Thorarchaeota archaeon]